LVPKAFGIQVDFDAERRVVTSHGIHCLPFSEVWLKNIGIVKNDVEL
jgi:hypothetical protein